MYSLKDILIDKYVHIYGKNAKSFINEMILFDNDISEILIELFFETGIRFTYCETTDDIKLSGYVYGSTSYEKSLVIVHEIDQILSSRNYKISDWNTKTVITRNQHDFNSYSVPFMTIPRFDMWTDIYVIINTGRYET